MVFVPCDLHLWPFDIWINRCRATSIKYMCTKFDVDSPSRFPPRARTNRQAYRHTKSDVFDGFRNRVTLICKRVPLHKTCQCLPAVCYITSMLYAVRLALSPNAKILEGGQKLANRCQPFLDHSSPNLGASREVTADWQVSFRLFILCSVVKIFSFKVRSRSQTAVLAPSPWG